MERKDIFTSKAPAPIGPYNQAVKAGNTLYISGQIGLDAMGNFMSDSLETECRQVMENISQVLKTTGMGWDNVVKCSIFLKNMEDFLEVNSIYASYFNQGVYPARETIQVARLPKDARVEISCIAVDFKSE